MPCDMRVAVRDLAEQGWTDDDIDLLEKEIEVARAKANRKAVAAGFNRAENEAPMNEAERETRKVAPRADARSGRGEVNSLLPGGAATPAGRL